MFRVINAFLFDGVSWLLLFAMFGLLLLGVAHLFNRYDQLDIINHNLVQLERDIQWLNEIKAKKQDWIERLNHDPTAWEMVAREKMNYLGHDQVLVKFVSVPLQHEWTE